MPQPDVATVTIAVCTVLTWLLGISYQLGQYTQRQKTLEKEADGTAATIAKIFEKLDKLSDAVPHKCDQVQTLFEMRGEIAASKEKLSNLEEWRHRVGKRAGELRIEDKVLSTEY